MQKTGVIISEITKIFFRLFDLIFLSLRVIYPALRDIYLYCAKKQKRCQYIFVWQTVRLFSNRQHLIIRTRSAFTIPHCFVTIVGRFPFLRRQFETIILSAA